MSVRRNLEELLRKSQPLTEPSMSSEGGSKTTTTTTTNNPFASYVLSFGTRIIQVEFDRLPQKRCAKRL